MKKSDMFYMTDEEILDLEIPKNDANAKTFRDYFKALLLNLIVQEEGFSGKRPFGNSGWIHELYIPLIQLDLVKGKLDEDGYVEEVDYDAADLLLKRLVKAL
jgi:hypothetical protein